MLCTAFNTDVLCYLKKKKRTHYDLATVQHRYQNMYFAIKRLKQQIVKHTGAACFCSQTPSSLPDATSRRESERKTTACCFGPNWSVHTHWSGIQCYCRRRLVYHCYRRQRPQREFPAGGGDQSSCLQTIHQQRQQQRQGNLHRQQLPFMFSGFADHNCQPPLLDFESLLLHFPYQSPKCLFSCWPLCQSAWLCVWEKSADSWGVQWGAEEETEPWGEGKILFGNMHTCRPCSWSILWCIWTAKGINEKSSFTNRAPAQNPSSLHEGWEINSVDLKKKGHKNQKCVLLSSWRQCSEDTCITKQYCFARAETKVSRLHMFCSPPSLMRPRCPPASFFSHLLTSPRLAGPKLDVSGY